MFTDPLGLDNDCGGPCTDFTLTFGDCALNVAYHKETGEDGKLYDIPNFFITCPTPQASNPIVGGRSGGRPSKSSPKTVTAAHCAGEALKKNGVSVALDVIGAIPALGNVVSASAAGARAVDGIVGFGSAAYGITTGLKDEAPYGAISAASGLGFTLAGTALEGSKAIPVAGNVLSGLTGLYDIYQGYKTYQQCVAGK